MLRILYTGAFRFPDQDAAAKRVLANGMALNKLGHTVFFAGWEQHERAIDKIVNGYDYLGFGYTSQDEFRNKTVSSLLNRLLGFLFRGKKTLSWLLKQDHFDVIIVYNPPAIFALKLLLFCRKNKIKLVLDSTEWYESSHLIGGKYSLASIENFVRMHFIYPKFNRFIVISDYLECHFKQIKGCIVKIPPLLMSEINKKKITTNITNGIRLIYAGSPGLKDDIFSIMLLLPMLNKEIKFRIVLRVLGPSPKEIKYHIEKLGGNYFEIFPFMELYSKVPMNEVEFHYNVSDLSIIFRENKRYAKAGFPTKFTESLSYGVPVISSRVGDIQKYIQKYNVGFLIDNNNSFFYEIKSIILLYIENVKFRQELKENCYNLAEKFFMFDNHIENIKKVL